MLIFGLAGVIGLGWAVRDGANSEQRWFVNLLGEKRCDHLQHLYILGLGTLFPADSDGDGFPDCVEEYLRCSPRDPLSHPETDFQAVDAGFTAVDFELHRSDLGFVLQPGERRHLRVRLCIEGQSAMFARGVKWSFAADSPVLLCLPGGIPAGEPVLVPMASDGIVEFDLAIPGDAEPTGLLDRIPVTATHPVTHEEAGGFGICIASRLPPLPFTVEDVAIGDVAEGEGDWHFVKGKRLVRLTWKPEAASGLYYVEATRDEAEREWLVIAACRTEEPFQTLIAYELDEAGPGHRGALKFRIVPTKPVPPRE
jgi:hypothetical protein